MYYTSVPPVLQYYKHDGAPMYIYGGGSPLFIYTSLGGSPSLYTWGYRLTCSTGVLGLPWCNTLIQGGSPPLYIWGGRGGSPSIYIWGEGGPPSIYTWGVRGGPPLYIYGGYRHTCSTGVLRVRWCNTLIQGGPPGGVPWGGGAPLYIYGGVPPLYIYMGGEGGPPTI